MARFIITGEYKDKATKDARKDLRSLSKDTTNFGKLAQRYWKLAAKSAAAYYAVRYGTQAVKAAAEDERSQKLLANTLSFVAGANDAAVIAAEANIQAMSKMYGVADDDLRPALSKLARVTGSVSAAANELDLALNLSTVTGYSLETVTNAITKAQNGNYKSLKSLGLKLDENLVKNKDTSAILKQLKAQYSDFAKSSLDTTAMKFQKINVAASEAKETIGVALVDAINKLIAGQGGVDGITTKFEQLSNHISDIIVGLTGVIEKTKEADAKTGNIIGRTAKWIYQNWTILGVLGKQGKQLKINEALIKSATTQTISARNAEMTALRAKKDAVNATTDATKKTLEQLMAEEAARKAGFKITEDIDSIQTVAAAKRLEESKQYKMSVIDAAQTQYEALKSNYEMLNSIWETQSTAFKVLKSLMEAGIKVPVAFQAAGQVASSNAGGGFYTPTSAIDAYMPVSENYQGSSYTPPSWNNASSYNITVNAGAVGSEQYLADVIAQSLAQATRLGLSTTPSGYIGSP